MVRYTSKNQDANAKSCLGFACALIPRLRESSPAGLLDGVVLKEYE
jgi:hypothetical protein